jgi:hypothetical protein
MFNDQSYQIEIEDKLMEGECIDNIIKNPKFKVIKDIPIPENSDFDIFFKEINLKNYSYNYNEWIKYFNKASGHST